MFSTNCDQNSQYCLKISFQLGLVCTGKVCLVFTNRERERKRETSHFKIHAKSRSSSTERVGSIRLEHFTFWFFSIRHVICAAFHGDSHLSLLERKARLHLQETPSLSS
jgi:hypothetical protein